MEKLTVNVDDLGQRERDGGRGRETHTNTHKQMEKLTVNVDGPGQTERETGEEGETHTQTHGNQWRN